MGWVSDLKSIPGDIQTNSVLKERIQLYEDKYNSATVENDSLKAKNSDLEKRVGELTAEITDLREHISSIETSESLSEGDTNVLLHLYGVKGQRIEGRPFDRPIQPNDVRAMGPTLSLDAAKLEYHLNRLSKMGLADVVSATTDGGLCWGLTEDGIAYVIENGLI